MSTMISLLNRLMVETRDRLYYSQFLRRTLGAAILRSRAPAVSSRSPSVQIAASIRPLCRTARLQRGTAQARTEAEIHRRVALTDGKELEWGSFIKAWQPERIENAVVLKGSNGEFEKGVVYIAFEYQWARLMNIRNLREFARRNTLIIGPSTSPPHCIETTLFCARYPDDRLFSLISNRDDIAVLPRLSNKISVIPLFASNWVNPDLYPSVELDRKDVDIVMVANFGRPKRHFALFRALRDLPRSMSVLLVGQPDGGRDRTALLNEARQYGVQNRFELRECLSHEDVMRSLAQARVSVVLSRLEGSCLAVVESMFANTPVGIYEDAIMGSRVFINGRTGRFLRRAGLASQLQDFVAAADTYSPRKWVLESGVSCCASTRVLNSALKESAIAAGQEWTHDIAAFYRRPEPVLLRPDDRERLRAAYDDIRDRYGVAIGMSGSGQ